MSLYEEIAKEEEELKKIVAEENGDEYQEPEDKKEDDLENDSGDKQQDESKDAEEDAGEPEKKEVEKKAEEVEEPEELKPDASAFARMRKEKRESDERSAALEARLAALEGGKDEPKVEEPVAPDPEDDFEGHLKFKQEQNAKEIAEIKAENAAFKAKRAEEQKVIEEDAINKGAIEEIQKYGVQYQAKVPDYGQAVDFMYLEMKKSLERINPSASAEAVEKAATRSMIEIGAQAYQDGINPAEKLYQDAKQRFGYVKQEVKANNDAPASKKPDINSVDKNRKRSASSLSGGGRSASATALTKEAVDNMSLQDFAKLDLTPDKLRALED